MPIADVSSHSSPVHSVAVDAVVTTDSHRRGSFCGQSVAVSAGSQSQFARGQPVGEGKGLNQCRVKACDTHNSVYESFCALTSSAPLLSPPVFYEMDDQPLLDGLTLYLLTQNFEGGLLGCVSNLLTCIDISDKDVVDQQTKQRLKQRIGALFPKLLANCFAGQQFAIALQEKELVNRAAWSCADQSPEVFGLIRTVLNDGQQLRWESDSSPFPKWYEETNQQGKKLLQKQLISAADVEWRGVQAAPELSIGTALADLQRVASHCIKNGMATVQKNWANTLCGSSDAATNHFIITTDQWRAQLTVTKHDTEGVKASFAASTRASLQDLNTGNTLAAGKTYHCLVEGEAKGGEKLTITAAKITAHDK